MLLNKLISQETLGNTKDNLLIIVYALLFMYIFKFLPLKNKDYIVFIKNDACLVFPLSLEQLPTGHLHHFL